MRFHVKMSMPEGKANNINRHIRSVAEKEMKQAITNFLSAMLARIPVRTGFLSGSFLKVSRKYGLSRSHTVSPQAGLRDEYYYGYGGGRIRKTPESGQQFVTDPENTFTKPAPNVFEFNLNNFINYWRINDLGFNPRVPGTPWGGIDAGIRAFNKYLSNIHTRFDGIAKEIKNVKITVS